MVLIIYKFYHFIPHIRLILLIEQLARMLVMKYILI